MCISDPRCTAVAVVQNATTGMVDCFFSSEASLGATDFLTDSSANSWIKSKSWSGGLTTAAGASPSPVDTTEMSDTSSSVTTELSTTFTSGNPLPPLTTSSTPAKALSTTPTPTTTSTTPTTTITTSTTPTTTTATTTSTTTPQSSTSTTPSTTTISPSPCNKTWPATNSSATGFVACNSPDVLNPGAQYCLLTLGPVVGSSASTVCPDFRASLATTSTYNDFANMVQFLRSTNISDFKNDQWVNVQNNAWAARYSSSPRTVDLCEWAPGQPSRNSSYCGSLSSSTNFLLMTEDCSKLKSSLCRRSICSITFYVHNAGQMQVCNVPDWASADQQCQNNGGTLFVAASDTEVTAVQSHLQTNSQYFASNTWCGIKEGLWTNGRSVTNALWISGIVNQMEPGTCGALSKRGNFLLQSYNCSEGMDALCRMPSTSG